MMQTLKYLLLQHNKEGDYIDCSIGIVGCLAVMPLTKSQTWKKHGNEEFWYPFTACLFWVCFKSTEARHYQLSAWSVRMRCRLCYLFCSAVQWLCFTSFLSSHKKGCWDPPLNPSHILRFYTSTVFLPFLHKECKITQIVQHIYN